MIPTDPPKLLPGKTANYWTLRYSICLLLTIPGMPFIAAGLIGGSVGFFLGWAGLTWVLVWCVLGFYATARDFSAERREKAAGYTTLNGRGFRKYWQLDPRTGAVLRRPE